MSNVQKTTLRQQRNDKSVHVRLFEESSIEEGSVSLSMPKAQSRIIGLDEKSSPGSMVSENPVKKFETSLSCHSGGKIACTITIDHEANCYRRSAIDGLGSCYLTTDCYHHGSQTNHYREPFGTYLNRSSHQRVNHYRYNNYNSHQQSCPVRQSEPHHSGRSTFSQSHTLLPRSNSYVTNGRSRMPLESEKDNAPNFGSGKSGQEEATMVEPQVPLKGSPHQLPDSLNSALQESMQQESVQQSALAQDGASTEYSESALTVPSTRFTSSVLPPSSTVEKTHEVWELSEALDKLREQQCTLTHYIRQLKHIRRQKSEEKRLLRQRRSALLREMNLSDSEAETGSSDEFNDDIADGLDPIETVVEGDNAGEFVVSTSGSSSNAPSLGAGIIAEAGDQGRSTCRTFLSPVAEAILDTDTSSVVEVTTVLSTSEPSAEGGIGALTPDGSELPMPPRWARKHPSRSDRTHPLSVAGAAVEASSGCLAAKGFMALRGSRRYRHKNSRNVVFGKRSSRRVVSKRRTRTQASFSTTKKRKLAQNLTGVEVKSKASQQICDEKATGAVSTSAPKSGVDPARLRWVRQLLSHPQSRIYTFAELDKLVVDLSLPKGPRANFNPKSNLNCIYVF
ncbi:hypothetical protein TcWFU_008868 [Taenia crassiceps]|uniref:Uncharacterized protein n=1 Tax=Taenia crassiceps TaxID=6207 RepID=A0ABR4QHW6_9CEST